MKTTPGPWKVESGGFVGGPAGFGQVCQLWNKHEEDFQNAKGNASLIAAAPDLLEACKLQHDALDLALATLIELKRDFYPSKSRFWPAILAGNAAIKKAAGAQ